MKINAKNARQYEDFHRREVDSYVEIDANPTPTEGWVLGELVSVVYRRPEETVPYEHKFSRPRPLLFSDAEGRGLFIAGGRYTVEPRGIVG